MYLFQFPKAPQDAESYIACHPFYKQIPFMALLDFQQKRNGLHLVSMSLVSCDMLHLFNPLQMQMPCRTKWTSLEQYTKSIEDLFGTFLSIRYSMFFF